MTIDVSLGEENPLETFNNPLGKSENPLQNQGSDPPGKVRQYPCMV